jgi:hypothetical protein
MEVTAVGDIIETDNHESDAHGKSARK